MFLLFWGIHWWCLSWTVNKSSNGFQTEKCLGQSCCSLWLTVIQNWCRCEIKTCFPSLKRLKKSPCLRVFRVEMFAASKCRVQVSSPGACWSHSRHILSKRLLQLQRSRRCRLIAGQFKPVFSWKFAIYAPCPFTVWWMYSQCTTERSTVKYNWIHPSEVQTPYKL